MACEMSEFKKVGMTFIHHFTCITDIYSILYNVPITKAPCFPGYFHTLEIIKLKNNNYGNKRY